MSERDFTIEHPSFTATKDARTKSRDLYQGTEAVREKETDYLFRETNERDAAYDLRLKRAVLDPYVEKIVEARQAVLFRRTHTRNLKGVPKVHLADVDKKDTPASTFFADAAREAQIDGIHWVAVDLPKAPEPGYRSRLDEAQAGHRPFFEHIPGSRVIDWEVADDGELLWAVIQQSTMDPRPAPGAEHQSVDEWKVWYRDRWEVWRLASDAGQVNATDRYALWESGPNVTGAVPLVPFPGIKHDDYSGHPVAKSVLDHVILIYNKMSDLDYFERLSSRPIPYVISPENPERLETDRGLWVCSDGPSGSKIEVGYLETSGSAFSSFRESIDLLVSRVFSIALAQAKKDSAQVQSAEGQREDRKLYVSSLQSVSLLYEAAEHRCWGLWRAWQTGQPQPPASTEEVVYDRDFDDEVIEAQMVQTLNSLADSNRLTTRTLLALLQKGEVIPLNIDIEEEVAALEAQRRTEQMVLLETIRQTQDTGVSDGAAVT